MKLQKRLKKALAITAVATTLASASAVFAMDYTGHWAEPVINEWKEKGVIDGYEDGSFKPKQHVTRAELAKMLVQVFGLTHKEGAEKFTDIPENAWYKEHVELVSAAGLMTGTDKEFRPNEMATREEAAYAVAQAYHVVAGKEVKLFKDTADISDWAKESVNALVSGGYINGYPDGTFKPQGQLTRAEMVTMLDKATAEIISKSATYTQDIEGNLVVNGKGVTLKDMTINGNLYIAEGVGESNITLDNVTVTGKIIVEGGGVDTIHIKGKSKFGDVIITKANKKPVRLDIKGTATVTGTVEVYSPVIIQGTAVTLPKVVVAGPTETVEIKGTVTVENLAVDGKAEVILTGTNVVVKGMTIGEKAAETKIKGNGTVDKLTVNADKVVIDKNIALDKENITTGANVTVPPVVEKPTSGGGGGGNGGETTTPSFALGNATITMTDGTPVVVNLNVNNLEVDATGKQITIGGVAFDSTKSIATAQAEAGVKNVTVSAIPGATKDDVTLESGKVYTVADLVTEAKAKEAWLNEVVDQFSVGEGETPTNDKPLSAAQAKKAKAWITEGYKILEAGAKDGKVSVAAIEDYIQQAKTKINAHGGVERINREFGAVLKFADIKLTDNNGTITAVFNIQASAKDHKTNTIQVTVKF